MDENQMFSVPVVESYPELKESYLQRILEPMDFRTIEEDRLNYYLSICDLQQDLILVFRNCMAYNDTGSPPYNTAR